MSIEFKKVNNFNRGIFIELLKDAYSFDCKYEQACKSKWQENDDFFFDNLQIADKYCFITTLNDEAIELPKMMLEKSLQLRMMT